MATKWSPHTEKRSYLLANGTHVDAPDLEKTDSTRPRFRFVGDTNSYGSRQIETEIINKLEADSGSKVIVRASDINKVRDNFASAMNMSDWPTATKTAPTIAEITQANEGRSSYSQTHLWWRFAHPTMPFEAVLHTTLQRQYGTLYETTQLLYQSTHVLDRDADAQIAFYQDQWPMPSAGGYASNYYGIRQQVLGANPPIPAGKTKIFGHGAERSTKAALRNHMAKVRIIESVDEITIPFFPDETSIGGYLTLKRVDSNVTGEYMNQLADFLDSREVVGRVAEAHAALVQALSDAGVVVEGAPDDDSIAGTLAAGTKVCWTQCQADDVGGPDSDHKVRLNLLTGTVVVDCTSAHNHRSLSLMNEAKEAWEVARFQAELTGTEDELLAYARRYAEEARQVRAKEIEKEAKS